MFVRLTDKISVAGQLQPGQLAEAAAAGFSSVINNRPDGEEPVQPTGATIETAARDAGLAYVAIPVTSGGLSMAQVESMAAALAAADGPVLAFCRSGTRSTMLWALAEASRGGDPDALAAIASSAGYDLSSIMPALRQLATQGK